MSNEEKDLLLKDLCARLPYGVKVQAISVYGYTVQVHIEGYCSSNNKFYIDLRWRTLDEFKPYLRPMSSMTDEEREEWADLFNLELDKLNEIDDENKAEDLAPYYFGKSHQVSIDWLNTYHFDYRGLIPMGLALEAPKDMYKID